MSRAYYIVTFILFFIFIWGQVGYSLEISKIQKHKEALSVQGKIFDYNPGEPVGLFGFKHKKYIDDNWFWGEAGYGAITGKRSGYIEGGLLFGRQNQIIDRLGYELSLFVGAGGGGLDPVKEGDGFMIYPSLGIKYEISSSFNIVFHFGFLKYINGTLDTTWSGIDINYVSWSLYE